MADNLNAGRLVYYPPEIRQQMFDLGLIGEEHLDTGPKILPYDTRQPIKPIPMVDGRSPAFLASNNSAALAALLRRLYSE
jgi:hypothetical protein